VIGVPDLLIDVKFLGWLFAEDTAMAERVREAGCPYCGGVLHRAHYPRKVRGIGAEAEGLFEVRFSFCCQRCRRRQTPASLRFLGRRIYAGAAVLVAAVLMLMASAVEAIRRVGAVKRTLGRWMRWWRVGLFATDFWRGAAGQFRERPDAMRMPLSVLEQLAGESDAERLALALRWLKPLTTSRVAIAVCAG
jgi:hypothetical protein